MKTKKPPMRMCIGCNERKEKKELIRVVRDTSGNVKIDYPGKANGRGAYLCHKSECFKKSIKSNALSRALEVSVGEELLEQLKEEYESL